MLVTSVAGGYPHGWGRGKLQDQVPVADREGGACGVVRGLLVVFHWDHAPAGLSRAAGVADLPRFSSSTAMSTRSVSSLMALVISSLSPCVFDV